MNGSLPLIRLSAVNPFLLELRRRELDASGLLRELDLPADIPASNELFVSSQMIYQLVEKSAVVAGDPYFGFRVGGQINLPDWDPIALAAATANSVGDLLNHFVVNAPAHSSSARFFLRTEGDRTAFGFRRVAAPQLVPAQNDAFYFGMIVRILRFATRDHWDPTMIVFKVADPDAVPPLQEKVRILKGDHSGTQVSFPSGWLFEAFEKKPIHSEPAGHGFSYPPASLIEAVHIALLPHMHEPDLNVDRAAIICGYNKRRLAKQLRSKGTTLGKEIASLRAERAREDLVNSDQRISDIAQSVGFTDPTIFSRAFKNWTGQSPQEYRKTHR
jgi:AraC-like DNA-binding protein